MKLVDKKCAPCQGGVQPLHGEALQRLRHELGGDWDVVEDRYLKKTFKFRDFREALDFTNCVGQIAEAEGHHPEITLTWGRVTLRIWTHKIDGLTESDFILAAKADEALHATAASQPAA